MALENIYTIYKSMERANIVLSFKGIVTANFLSFILEIMEAKMTYLGEAPSKKKKVLSVLVECLQNLYHHIEHESESNKQDWKDTRSALIMVIKEGDCFIIRTGNFIEKKGAAELEEKLNKISGMDKETLRKYYQEVLGTGSISHKGTAGLGLIDIARKSHNNLNYEFLDVDEHSRFFSLNVKIY
jgi:hypothetical protein